MITRGHAEPTSSAWIGATVAARAAALGVAPAILWALVATFIKAMTDTLTLFGVFGMFAHWPVYALIIVSITAELLDQTALHVGPLSISQPFIVIVDPMASIVLSVWIFDEVFTENPLRLTVGVVSFAVMAAAAAVLAHTTPATMEHGPAPATSPPPERS
jgi:hypothetical protein